MLAANEAVAATDAPPLKDKWKTFAMGQVMSLWGEGEDRDDEAVECFDALTDATCNDHGRAVMEERNIVPWEPFEDWTVFDLASLVYSMASTAQHYEETMR